jgi:hypothetical protein
MSTHPNRKAVWSLGLLLGLAQACLGQTYAPRFEPPDPLQDRGPLTAAPSDLNSLTHEMAERVRHLAEDVASDMGATPEGQHLLRDTREVAGAVDLLHENLHRDADPVRVARSYREIDSSWHHVKDQLAQLGATPAVLRAAGRVEEIDRLLHQSRAPAGRPWPAGMSRTALRPAYNPAAAVAPVADGLAAHADQFVQRFVATTSKVPEGAGFIADISRLRDVAGALAQDAQVGQSPEQLVPRVAQLNQAWAVLKARLDRVANGRPLGPNIADLLDMGDTVAQITQLLDPRAILQAPEPFPPQYGGRFDPRPGVMPPYDGLPLQSRISEGGYGRNRRHD